MDPKIVEFTEQPYVGRRESVTMTDIARVADHLPGMAGWLRANGVTIEGAPFFRYRVIDATADLVVEAGIPVAGPVEAPEPMFNEVLPAGRYATLTHVGHPNELMTVTARLLDWGRDHGLTWDMEPTPTGEVWNARLEVLLTDPAEQPDPHQWETLLQFKIADQG